MASYRFCRSDDIELLVAAYNACWLPHFPDRPPMSVDRLRRATREIDLWTSSCMVVSEGAELLAVMLATKRDDEALIHSIAVHPSQLRQGHARHMLTSLSAKLAILGPPRLVAEVPVELAGAAAFLEACGWRREVDYTDYTRGRREPAGPAPDMLIPATLDDLVANGAFEEAAVRCWQRSPRTLLKIKDRLRGLAVASPERIEASVLYEDSGDDRRVMALQCVDPQRSELWLGLLLDQCAGGLPLTMRRVHPDEVPARHMRAWGLEPGRVTAGYATRATAA